MITVHLVFVRISRRHAQAYLHYLRSLVWTSLLAMGRRRSRSRGRRRPRRERSQRRRRRERPRRERSRTSTSSSSYRNRKSKKIKKRKHESPCPCPGCEASRNSPTSPACPDETSPHEKDEQAQKEEDVQIISADAVNADARAEEENNTKHEDEAVPQTAAVPTIEQKEPMKWIHLHPAKAPLCPPPSHLIKEPKITPPQPKWGRSVQMKPRPPRAPPSLEQLWRLTPAKAAPQTKETADKESGSENQAVVSCTAKSSSSKFPWRE